MGLTAGDRFGAFEIVAPLGAGGMGEVYRARDTRLDRVVAIKVLSPSLAGDASFRQRLHTEARAISQLSHPHICTLHDIGEHNGVTFLVMELIDGETLADRLRRVPGQGLPLAEAIRLGTQVADALAAAHRRGIVHRDLKPGNVMLARTTGGTVDVKLLDFGLAKVQPVASLDSATRSTTPPAALTSPGTVLGTFQYMSPEQIEGVEADSRSDIFALGCVLYEMLAGRPAFEGKSRTAIMAAILEREPAAVSALQPAVPALVSHVVARCLAKNPEARWQSAVDVAAALRLAESSAGPATISGEDPKRRTAMVRLAMAASAIAVIAIAALAVQSWRTRNSPAAVMPELRFEILPPTNAAWTPSPVASTAQLALSPDGRRLAFVAASKDGPPQIWLRDLDTVVPRALAGTEDASFPFWSPDGRSIGFNANGKLKRIDTTGGAAQVLANAPLGRGGSWNTDDVILYSPSPSQGIWRVSAMGGTPTAVTLARSNDGATRIYPHFLADGRRFIYYLRSEDLHRQGIYVSSLDAAEERMVIQNNGLAVAGPGQIVLVRDGMLFAQAVDEATMQTRGNPVRIADGVGFSLGIIGYSPIAVGGSALAFGPPVRSITALQWHERNGKAGSVLGRGEYRSPRVSPDGRRVALTVLDSKANSPDVWTMDLARGALSRVSHDSATDWFPAWSPDSLRVYFGSGRSRSTTIYVKATAANEPEQQVIPPTTARYPLDVTSEGVLFQSAGLTTESSGYDLGLLTVTEPQALRVVVSTPFNEVQARVSPNGRWMAYASDESGRYEVYVRDFPAGRDQVTISRTGGMQPEWRGDGRELFFVSADRQLMSVAVSGDAQVFSAQLPRPLFAVDLPQPTPPYPNDYAVSADGQRFLINTLVEQPLMPITVVLNWRGQK